MPRMGMMVVREIVEDILSDQNEVKIPEQVLLNMIKKHAGLDQRTLDKYFKAMFETRHAAREGHMIVISR